MVEKINKLTGIK